jgi:F420-non-reducing hydrogenase iron-sulfur subunit
MAAPSAFEPRILGFLCNWCSYAGADLAGVSRFQYPTSIRIIRVMCSGRVDPTMVLEAFIQGIDGVIVLGCHPGECHYITGNYYAEIRMKTVQKLLEKMGINPNRLSVDWISASEGERFATLVGDFTGRIGKYGPLGSETPSGIGELKFRLKSAQEMLSQQRIRWLIGREKNFFEEGDVYGEKVDQDEFKQLVIDTMIKEYSKNMILLSIKDVALPVREIAQKIDIPSHEVLRSLISLEQAGLVTVTEIDGNIPKYRSLEAK